jgi:tetratricopeptide (TPR) repeat protein
VEFNYKYATCIFHTDDIKKSKKYFDYLLRQNDFPPEVYYYRARIYQHEYAFSKAIEFYKKYQELKPKKEQIAGIPESIATFVFSNPPTSTSPVAYIKHSSIHLQLEPLKQSLL